MIDGGREEDTYDVTGYERDINVDLATIGSSNGLLLDCDKISPGPL